MLAPISIGDGDTEPGLMLRSFEARAGNVDEDIRALVRAALT